MQYYPRLKHLREDKEKTQSEIAKILNTTHQYYSAYKRGLRDIPLNRVKKLAIYYNVTIDYIAGLTDKKRPIE